MEEEEKACKWPASVTWIPGSQFSVVCSLITGLGVLKSDWWKTKRPGEIWSDTERQRVAEWHLQQQGWFSRVLMCRSEEESLGPYVAPSTAQVPTDWLHLCYLGCLAFFSSPKWSCEFWILGRVTGRRWEPASGSCGGGGGGGEREREAASTVLRLLQIQCTHFHEEQFVHTSKFISSMNPVRFMF